MGYRCWLASCGQEIEGGTEVWQDAAGKPVVWREASARKQVPVDPAPYHLGCAEVRRAGVLAQPLSAPVGVAEGSNLVPEGASSSAPVEAPPFPTKKNQLRLF